VSRTTSDALDAGADPGKLVRSDVEMDSNDSELHRKAEVN